MTSQKMTPAAFESADLIHAKQGNRRENVVSTKKEKEKQTNRTDGYILCFNN